MATIKTLLGYVKGPKGDTGETGGTGPAGAAATISVGTTTQVASTLPAKVTNVGTASAAVLNFEIPEGRPGSVGEISGYAVNSITTQQGNFPTPVIGDTIATIVGKQAKATDDAKAGIQTALSDASDALDAATAASASIANILGDFGTVESAATASKAYEVGDYLVLNEQFYKVTAAIAQGNALTPGGNIEPTNVGAEVASLNKDLANMDVILNNKSYTAQTDTPINTDGYKYISVEFSMPNCGSMGARIYDLNVLKLTQISDSVRSPLSGNYDGNCVFVMGADVLRIRSVGIAQSANPKEVRVTIRGFK